MSQPTIVVGMDHTPAGIGAIRYAVERAHAVSGRVRIVRAVPKPRTDQVRLERDLPGERRTAGNRAFDWVFDVLARMKATVPIVVETVDGTPVEVLTAESQNASALVVGTPEGPDAVMTDVVLRGLRAGTSCLLIEVTAAGEAARATGPVSRTPRTPTQRPDPIRSAQSGPAVLSGRAVIVGVDGSPGGVDALEWASAYAAATGTAVQVVRAYRERGDEPEPEMRAAAERDISDALARVRLAPEVHVAVQVVRGEPVDVLTRLSSHAHLLVLGRHGMHGMSHSAMGAVGDACSRLAGCPVMIVPTGSPVGPQDADALEVEPNRVVPH